VEEDQSAFLHCYEVDTHNYGELSAGGKKNPTATHSILAIEGCRRSVLWKGLPGRLNWVANFFRCSTRTLVISCVLMSVISWNTDPSPLTLQQRATEEDGDELHSEPRNPDRGLKFLDLRSDDYEGSVHHHVSRGRGDIGSLQKHKTRTVNGTVREYRTLGYSPRHQCDLCQTL